MVDTNSFNCSISLSCEISQNSLLVSGVSLDSSNPLFEAIKNAVFAERVRQEWTPISIDSSSFPEERVKKLPMKKKSSSSKVASSDEANAFLAEFLAKLQS